MSGRGRKITGNTGYLSQEGGVPCVIHTANGPNRGLYFEDGGPNDRVRGDRRRDRTHLALVYNASCPWVGWVLRSRVELREP